MIDKLKDLFRYMNERGIPAPMFRDHGKASVSLTLLIISSICVVVGILPFLIPEAIDQVNGWLALAWFVTNAVLYYNRGAKISRDGIEISGGKDEVHKD